MRIRRIWLVGMFAFMTAAVAATPAVSRPSPTPSLRPPTASARPFLEMPVQKGGGGGGGKGGGIGGGIGKGGGGGFGGGMGKGPGGFGPGGFGPGGFGPGIGIGIGIGGRGFYGPGYYPYSYYSYPYYYNYPYSYGSPYYYSPYSGSFPLIQSPEVLPAPSSDAGLRIVELHDGAAKAAHLRAGDTIIAVGKTRVQTFEQLAAALSAAEGELEITYIPGGSANKLEKVLVTPVKGKIGIAVIPVDVGMPIRP